MLGGGGGSGSELSISEIASYQPSDGLLELKKVCLFFFTFYLSRFY